MNDDPISNPTKDRFEHQLSQLMHQYDQLSWHQRAMALSWHAELAWSKTEASRPDDDLGRQR